MHRAALDDLNAGWWTRAVRDDDDGWGAKVGGFVVAADGLWFHQRYSGLARAYHFDGDSLHTYERADGVGSITDMIASMESSS